MRPLVRVLASTSKLIRLPFVDMGSSQHVVAPIAPIFVANTYSWMLASIVFLGGCGLELESKASKRLLRETIVGGI